VLRNFLERAAPLFGKDTIEVEHFRKLSTVAEFFPNFNDFP
jgi:hypothetical protein